MSPVRLKNFAFFVIAAALSFVPNLPALRMGAPIPHGTGRLWMHRDEATILADSARLTWGELIYRDFFEFPGPVPFFLNAGVFELFGPSVLVARWFFILVVTLAGLLLALTVRRFLGMAAGLAAALVHSAGLVTFWQCNYPHWFAELFILAGLYLYASAEGARGRRVAAGACLGLAIWSIQSLGLPAAIAATALSFVPGLARRDLKSAAREGAELGSGVLLATAVVVSPFVFAGGLGDMLFDMFVWPFSNYGHGQKDNAGYASELARSIAAHAQLPATERLPAIAVLLGNVSLPVLLALTGLPQLGRLVAAVIGRAEAPRHSMVAVTALAALSPLLLGVSRSDQAHIAFTGGVALVGVSASLHALTPRLRLAPIAVFCAWATLAAVSYGHKLHRVELSAERWEAYVARQADTKWVLANSTEKDELVDGTHWAGMRYMFFRRPASPFTLLPEPGHGDYYSPEQWRELADSIERERPALLLLTAYQFGRLIEVAPPLAESYVRVTPGRYRRRPPPPPTGAPPL